MNWCPDEKSKKPFVLDMGILVVPSIRVCAYLRMLDSCNMVPREMIVLDGAVPEYASVCREARVYRYANHFFDPCLKIRDWMARRRIRPVVIRERDIHHPSVIRAVSKSTSSYILYTGGGIVRETLLNQGKLFIHIHPGWLPDYRGSTCFYYSLLNDYTLGSSAFIMDKQIDTGKLIARSRFRINYRIRPGQAYFMDYVLDPFIRAWTFRKVLQALRGKGIRTVLQPKMKADPYFVIHPYLRHKVIQIINKQYQNTIKKGIWEVETHVV